MPHKEEEMNNSFLSEFQIIGSSIKSLRIKNDFILLENWSNKKRKIDISHSVRNVEMIEEGKVLSGIVDLNIKVNIFEKKRKYNLDMTIEGCFNAPCELGEETFNSMLQVNGITALYSIARGFVQSTSAQTLVSGYVLLPMINVVAYSRNLNQENNDAGVK